ncbi:solute carrier family 17 member 9b [Sinocyclocheilus rhinocerous]|uniref:solute carrier family 17 member 9b n=1 Tax=Sinocyclocheilus rhinocerous TaxID=307959 RepID=UPI0007BA036E|nr:PREDICTED: solute carrier family 17 member 9-like [Sinocyclocheilus rhinocerous]
MAILQKHGKNSCPDLASIKENPADNIGQTGSQKKWAESSQNWTRPVARVWTVVLLLGTCLLYCARVAMPICAVSMAERFSWSKRETGMVLGSFFWGYCFTQVLGGYVSDRVGGEKVLMLSAAAWGAMTAFTPILAHFCSQPIVSMTISRFLMGLLQGVHYPSLASLCSQKVVESERGFLMSTVGSGSYLGTLVIGGIGSLMLDLYGWESVFYISGLLSVLWAYCMWKYLLKGEGVHYPSLASLCSQKVVESERGFLMSTVGSGSYLGTLVIGGIGSLMLDLYGWESVFYISGLLSVLWAYCMWKYLLKGEVFSAVIITHLCTASTFFTLLSWLPTFFKDTFPDAKGWVFNVIPWFVAIPSSLFSGCLSDHLISQGFDTASVRKLMQFFSMGVSSVFTLFLCGTTTFPTAVAFVSATMGLTTFSHSGVSVNVQDLAPSCAGALFGVMNTCGAFTGVIMVYFSGYLIEATGSWASVFGLITVLNLLGLGTFLCFAEARRVDIELAKGRYHNIHI